MFPKDLAFMEDLEYRIIEERKLEWELMSKVGQCAVFAFDCFTHKFVYVSEIGLEPFGLTSDIFLKEGHDPAIALIHPGDIPLLLLTRKKAYKLLQSIPSGEIKKYKLVHEFRIRNTAGKYIRITEQEQVIELDNQGNIWLTLSVFNIDAGNEKEPVKSHIYKLDTGEQIFIELSETLEEPLTNREVEVLKLIRLGLLSKEISDKLSISINTVNVHRQNIFNKLNVDNAMEAINQALALGLLN
jgi:DNA-binding CsgD family transcriptional regulator